MQLANFNNMIENFNQNYNFSQNIKSQQQQSHNADGNSFPNLSNNNNKDKAKQISEQQQLIMERISSYLQQHNDEITEIQKTGTKQGFQWRSVSLEQYPIDFDLTGGQNFGKTKTGWVWYKNLTIPMLTVTLSKNNDSSFNVSDQLYANIYCMKKLRCQNYAQVKLQEDSQQLFIDGIVNFKSLKFTETTLMSREGEILGIKISPPFQVDGRRKYWMERESVAQVMMPFAPEKLERNFEKVDKKDNQITHIGDDLKGLFDYYSSQTIRRKIRHPLFLLLRFPNAVRFFINTNLIQHTDNATLVKKIHQEIDTALKIQAKGSESNLGIENKPLLFQLRASQSDKIQQSYSNKMAKYLYIIDSVACQYQSFLGEVPDYFQEIPFSYELKDQYKKVHYQLTPFKGVDEDMDISEMYGESQMSEHDDRSALMSNNNLGQQQSQNGQGNQQFEYQKEEEDENNQPQWMQQFQIPNAQQGIQMGTSLQKYGGREFGNQHHLLNNSYGRQLGGPLMNNSYYSFRMNNSYYNNGQMEIPQFDPMEPLISQQIEPHQLNSQSNTQQGTQEFGLFQAQQQQLQSQYQQQQQSQQQQQQNYSNQLGTQSLHQRVQLAGQQLQQSQLQKKSSTTTAQGKLSSIDFNQTNQKTNILQQQQQSSQQQQQQQQEENNGRFKQCELCYFCQQHLAEQNNRYLFQRQMLHNSTIPNYFQLVPNPPPQFVPEGATGQQQKNGQQQQQQKQSNSVSNANQDLTGFKTQRDPNINNGESDSNYYQQKRVKPNTAFNNNIYDHINTTTTMNNFQSSGQEQDKLKSKNMNEDYCDLKIE